MISQNRSPSGNLLLILLEREMPDCLFMRWQEPVDSAPRYSEVASNVSWPHPLVCQLAHFFQIYTRLASFVDAPRLRGGDSLGLPLLAQVGLELGKNAKHVEERLAGGGAGVDRLLGRLERHSPALQLMDDILQILHRTGEPINPGDDKGVTLPQEVEQDLQFGSRAALRSAPDFFSDRIV